MTKSLLLAALALCCCITTLHAYIQPGCRCIRTTSSPVAVRVIQKIEVVPISGRCRRIEIIVTRKNNSKVCVNPNVKWINKLLSDLQRMGCINGRASSCVGRQLMR